MLISLVSIIYFLPMILNISVTSWILNRISKIWQWKIHFMSKIRSCFDVIRCACVGSLTEFSNFWCWIFWISFKIYHQLPVLSLCIQLHLPIITTMNICIHNEWHISLIRAVRLMLLCNCMFKNVSTRCIFCHFLHLCDFCTTVRQFYLHLLAIFVTYIAVFTNFLI